MPHGSKDTLTTKGLAAYFWQIERLKKSPEDASGDEVDDSAFVPISKLWPDHFDTYRKAKTFLDNHPQIRMRKPRGNRLQVHAGDWHTHLPQQTEPTDEQMQAWEAGIEERARQIREKKRPK